MKECGSPALENFGARYTQQINAIYKTNQLHALESYTWSGAICFPFSFSDGTVDWRGVEGLKGKLDALLHEQRGSALHVTRIARIYDDRFIFLLKPNRLRYWLGSVALRDADETLSDLRAQGF